MTAQSSSDLVLVFWLCLIVNILTFHKERVHSEIKRAGNAGPGSINAGRGSTKKGIMQVPVSNNVGPGSDISLRTLDMNHIRFQDYMLVFTTDTTTKLTSTIIVPT